MPNTKTKKFDWQIFLAVFCILLVICCATVCCVVSNTDKGVARADTIDYTFTVTDRLYLKNYSSATSDEIENTINYYFGFLEGLYDTNVTIDYTYYGGMVSVSYNTSSGVAVATAPIKYKVNQSSGDGFNLLAISLIIGDGDFIMASLWYESVSKSLLAYSTFTPVLDTDSGNYYIDCTPSAQNNSYFPYYLMQELLGQGNDATTINSISFNYNSDTNLRCFLSNTDSFYTPVDTPTGGYDEGYQDAVNELQPTIDELRQENSQLQTEVDRYETILEYTNWFTFIDSTYNNVRSSSFNGMKTTMRQNVEIDGNNGVYLSDTTGTAQGLICLLDFGTTLAEGTKVRFSWKDLMIGYQSGSSGPGAFLPVHLAVLSNGSLIDCYVTTEDTRIDGSCEFTLPTDAYGIYLYNSTATTYIFISAMTGEYYSYNPEEVYDSGYNNGFEVGKNQGIQLGRQEGYNQGVLDANDYSFFSLFTSVFDAPITAIVGKWGDSDGDGVYQREGGMLNFYIPGLDINFAPFLLSLFTIGIIVLIIRFILARKS